MISAVFKGWVLGLAMLFWLRQPHPLSASMRAAVVRNPIMVAGSGRKVAVTLAPPVEQSLRRYFPGFQVADVRDFSRYISPEQMEAPPKQFVPFACVGDFDGNGLPDVALMLKNSHRKWLFVAFHQTYRGTFRPYRLEAKQWAHDELVDAFGKVDVLMEALSLKEYFSDSLHLKHNDRRYGIHMIWDEEASRLFYFRDGRYRWLQTSD